MVNIFDISNIEKYIYILCYIYNGLKKYIYFVCCI